MPSVAWNYDGAATIVATITGATVGHTYSLNPDGGSGDTQVASTSTVVLTSTDVDWDPGVGFDVTCLDDTLVSYIASNIFTFGTASTTGTTRAATWDSDGATTIGATFTVDDFVAPASNHYYIDIKYFEADGTSHFEESGPVVGPGAISLSISTANAPGAGKGIHVRVFDNDNFSGANGGYLISRLFTAGTVGGGVLGNPGGTSAAPPDDTNAGAGGIRIGVAFDDPTLAPDPTWTYLTDVDNFVGAYDIRRGRQFEFDKTDAGTATITINDRDGLLDPTNVGSPYFGTIEPLLQIKIEVQHPISGVWYTRFRGFIEDYSYDVQNWVYVEQPSGDSKGVTTLTVNCVDLYEILNAIEMQPGEFGDTPDDPSTISFDLTDGQTRVEQVMGNAGIDAAFFVCFSLNIDMQKSVYSAGQTPLEVAQDVVDAEFPTVSNMYVDRLGRLAIHGRLAKFDPVTVAAGASAGAWDFHEWLAGDQTACIASPTDTAQIRALAFNRGLSKVFNSAACTPMGIARVDVPGQLAIDGTSIGKYGIRSWSADDLLIEAGTLTGNDANTECQAFAQFIVDNYKDPHNRIETLTFLAIDPNDARGPAVWDLLCQVDISDTLALTVGLPGGGLFLASDPASQFFVEGVTESARPLRGDLPFITLSLDLSPRANFAHRGVLAGGT